MNKKQIGFIPLRKGSKGITRKNKKDLLGRPLFSWCLLEAVFSELSQTIIFTDDDSIIEYIEKEYVWTNKIKAVKRGAENAGDKASTESAILEYCESINNNFDNFFLIQATSPMLRAEDINEGIDLINKGKYDSVLSVVRSHRFIWNSDGTPQNYDIFKRPRRQDFQGLLIENGALYGTSKAALLNSKNRLSGSIGLIEMSENSLVEIDTLTDWEIVENLLEMRLLSNKKPKKIKYLVLDFDVLFSEETSSINQNKMISNVLLEELSKAGLELVIITSQDVKTMTQTLKKLKIKHIYSGIKDKFGTLSNFILKHKLNFNNFAYIGGSVDSIANICACGVSFAPAKSIDKIKRCADYTLKSDSHEGALKEAYTNIIKLNKKYE